MSRDVRAFDYVNHPYDAVRTALMANAAGVFRSATTAATSRAESVASVLRVDVGGLQVSTAINLDVGTITESTTPPGNSPLLEIPIQWKAAERAGLFPVMNGTLAVYPLTSTETQLDFRGRYDPPLGPVGTAIDAALGHRIAEASVHRFVTEIAQHLRTTLR